jgi:iron complex transport system substrate-binding protein
MAVLTMTIIAAPQSETSETTTSGPATSESTVDYFEHKISVDYSTLFDVEYFGNYKIVTITEPWPGADSAMTYLLIQRGTSVPGNVDADKTIEVPVRSIVSMSTSYLPHIEMLGLLDTLVAVDAFAWISSETVIERSETGVMKEVGSGPSVNVELLVDMEPDLIMTFGMGGEWDTHPKLEEARLPYVINAEWNEPTPLGRAEWIKYMALFFNKEAEATTIFDDLASEYTDMVKMAAAIPDKPSVFIGAPYQGTWWVSGGASYAAQLLADAGATYVWSEDDSTGSLMLDVETVFDKAGKADFWINVGYWNSLADAQAADERFANFGAYKTGMVYNNNKRMGPGGGSDYYESSPAKPHVLLADLISIFHPGLLTDRELYYYKKLD